VRAPLGAAGPGSWGCRAAILGLQGAHGAAARRGARAACSGLLPATAGPACHLAPPAGAQSATRHSTRHSTRPTAGAARRYGKQLVPLEDLGQATLEYKPPKGFRLVGFIEAGQQPRALYRGDCYLVLRGGPEDSGQARAFQALVVAMLNKGRHAGGRAGACLRLPACRPGCWAPGSSAPAPALEPGPLARPALCTPSPGSRPAMPRLRRALTPPLARPPALLGAAVVRLVSRAGYKPLLGLLVPQRGSASVAEHFIMQSLPYDNDLRLHYWAPLKDMGAPEPSVAQRLAAQKLVGAMDLAPRPGAEALVPERTINPLIQRFYHVLGQRCARLQRGAARLRPSTPPPARSRRPLAPWHTPAHQHQQHTSPRRAAPRRPRRALDPEADIPTSDPLCDATLEPQLDLMPQAKEAIQQAEELLATTPAAAPAGPGEGAPAEGVAQAGAGGPEAAGPAGPQQVRGAPAAGPFAHADMHGVASPRHPLSSPQIAPLRRATACPPAITPTTNHHPLPTRPPCRWAQQSRWRTSLRWWRRAALGRRGGSWRRWWRFWWTAASATSCTTRPPAASWA
jgi:hypothetical protein